MKLATTPMRPPVPAKTRHLQRGGRSGVSNTLGRLQVFRAAVLVILLGWMLVGGAVLWQGHTTLVRARSVLLPEATAVQDIRASLAALDMATAQQLQHPPVSKLRLAEDPQGDRGALSNSLFRAAETGAADPATLATLEEGLGTYERLAQRAGDLREQEEGSELETYRQALNIMDEQLVPVVNKMDKQVNGELDSLAQGQMRSDGTGCALFVLCSFLGCAVLLVSQLFLSRRTRRTLNPALLGATLALAVASVHLLQSGARIQSLFHTALGETYPALHAGMEVRSSALASQAGAIRALLDKKRSSVYLKAAAREHDQVATLPPALTAAQLLGALREGATVDGFSGHLSDEIVAGQRPGEREAAIHALDAWLRSPEGLNSTSRAPTQLSAPEFSRALQQALQAHQRGLTLLLEEEKEEQRRAAWMLAIVPSLCGLLVLVGFGPRIREYK